VSARQRDGLPALLAELEDRYDVEVVELEGAPEAVFAEAQAATDPREAVARYEELVERWPDHERVPEALFMIGFKRSEELSDPEGAERAFRRLLDEFPDSELAQSARWMLSSEGNGSPAFDDASAGEPEESTP
jgi:outer membrane protein assembly factor BamD (BamD/ComL family)